MITKIELQNFKSFEELNLELTNFNIFFGLNGSGKSSVIQSLLLLRQSFLNNSLQSGKLSINGNYVKLGLGKDIYFEYAQNEEISFNLSSDKDKFISPFKFLYRPDTDVLDVKLKNPVDFQKLIDVTKFSQISLFNNNFQYLNAEHIGPKDLYPISFDEAINKKNLGISGEYTAQFLDNFRDSKINFSNLKHENTTSDKLLDQVNGWLSEISPNTIVDAKKSTSTNFALNYKSRTLGKEFSNEVKPINTGFGITYVLPNIVTILSTEENKLIISENPESHIHPKGQVKMGQLFSLAAQNNNQLIVETHSDHFINGVRVAIKNGLIDYKKVKIFFFSRKFEEFKIYSSFIPIKIDRNGTLNNYPEDFLDQWDKQLLNLI